ncbi:DMT family transporter [Clostridium sp. JN-9]|uniref:DMT family transporter n=1 Tax=Clostridium sp. JN-9 TaxID=2507159 RepID=UPI000FFE1117|nr:DMT family transporter [Clostridium sp. JN-9]QAT41222.1 DMT family transporter [Clostridium sp. JN-9]
MNKQKQADLMLFIVTLFWGASYLLIKISLDYMGEINLVALRFSIGFILSFIIFYKRILKVDFKTVKYAMILSSILFVDYIILNYGIKYSSITNAGFINSLTVIFIPVLSAVFLKQKPEKQVMLGIFLCTIGIGLLTINGRFQMGFGDLMCMLNAVLYAAHIIITGKLTKGADSVSLGVLQLGFVGLYSTIFSFIFETPTLPPNFKCWISVIVLSIFCTAFAFVVQTTSQQYTSASHTGLIFTLEPVFSAVIAFFFAGEVLTVRGYFGAVILLAGVLLGEVDLKSLFNNISN